MSKKLLPFSLLVGILAAAACAGDVPPTANERSEAGVQAVEKRWSEAFMRGETAYLNDLLAEDYISVNGSGAVRTKADIIEMSRKYAANNQGPMPDLPPSPVSIIGDAAIVQHDNQSERSVDVFYYRDGRWYAWYSQHTRK